MGWGLEGMGWGKGWDAMEMGMGMGSILPRQHCPSRCPSSREFILHQPGSRRPPRFTPIPCPTAGHRKGSQQEQDTGLIPRTRIPQAGPHPRTGRGVRRDTRAGAQLGRRPSVRPRSGCPQPGAAQPHSLPGRTRGQEPGGARPRVPSCLPGPDPALRGVWCPPVEQRPRRDAVGHRRPYAVGPAPLPCTAALHRSHALQLSTIPLHDSPAPQPSSRAVRRSCASYPRTAAMQRQLCVAGHAPPDERRAARAGLSHLPGRAAKARRVTPGAAASHDPIRCSVQSCPSAGTRCSAQGPVGFCPLRTITVPCQVGSRLQAAQGTAAGSVCRGA